MRRRTAPLAAVLGVLALGAALWWMRSDADEVSPRGMPGTVASNGADSIGPGLEGRSPETRRQPNAGDAPATSPPASPAAADLPDGIDAEYRARFVEELERGLALLATDDPASRVRGATTIKMAYLGVRSGAPALLTFRKEEVLAALVPLLADVRTTEPGSRHSVRMEVVDALRTWDWDGTIVVPALEKAWKDASSPLRAGMLDALVAIAAPKFLPAPAALRELTASDDADLRRSALLALGRHEVRTIQDFAAAGRVLADASAQVRREALVLLAEAGPEAVGWAREIEARWDDADRDVRWAARWALAAADPERARVLAHRGFGDARPEARSEAAWAFVNLGSAVRPADGDALLAALADPDPAVRAQTANALAYIPALKDRSIPALRALAAGGGHPAYEALGALHVLDAEGSIPDLAAALSSPEPLLRYLAVAQLAKAAPQRFAREIIAVLSDEAGQPRNAAERAVLDLREPPIDALVEALDKAHPEARHVVAQALGGQGRRAAAAVPALERHLETARDPAVRHHLERALKAIRAAR
jgi:HEAT repeat protein